MSTSGQVAADCICGFSFLICKVSSRAGRHHENAVKSEILLLLAQGSAIGHSYDTWFLSVSLSLSLSLSLANYLIGTQHYFLSKGLCNFTSLCRLKICMHHRRSVRVSIGAPAAFWNGLSGVW